MNKHCLPVHGLDLGAFPESWSGGLPLGNGGVGVMCWGKDRHLKFTLDHCDAWDLRHGNEDLKYEEYTYEKLRRLVENKDFEPIMQSCQDAIKADPIGPTKICLGRMELDYEFDKCSKFSLDLASASFGCRCGNAGEEYKVEAFVARHKDLFCLKFDVWPDGATLKYLPFYETSPGLAALKNPPVEIFEKENLRLAVQQILPDKFFAVCWNPAGPEVFVSVSYARDRAEAERQAWTDHPHSTRLTWAKLFAAHKKLWRDFWSVSGAALPERDFEFMWYYGIYMMAAGARRGSTPPGLQGLWAMDGRNPVWRGDYHTDMNVQEYFWSSCPSNHLDLLDCWLDYALKYLHKTAEYTRKIFGTEGAFFFCVYLPEYTPLLRGFWTSVNFAWSNTGWLAHLAWLRWRYGMDKKWLAETGYPLVKSAFQFYSANLREEADGKYHIPLSDSPEYEEDAMTSWCKDPNIDIALIRKCCDWVREMETALGISEYSQRAAEIHEKLVGYHLLEFQSNVSYVCDNTIKGPYVLGLWEGKLLDQPHRHPSHLMAIHPAMDITVDGTEEDRKIIEASLHHYLSLGQYCWAGHTYAQMISFAAVTGKPEMAYNFLCRFRDNWLLPNGLHFNREYGQRGNSHFSLRAPGDFDFDSEAPFTVNETNSITCGVSDMLVQGWGGVIRLFPAVPQRWKDMLFIDLRTEGAFLVSALCRDGAVRWVRVKASVDGRCRIKNPFGDRAFNYNGATPETDKDFITFRMKAGEQVELFAAGCEKVDLQKETGIIRRINRGLLKIV